MEEVMSTVETGEFGNGRYWYQVGGSQVITFGLTDAAIEDLGEIEAVNLPGEGDTLRSGDVCFSVEGTQGSVEFLLPFAARVDSINARVVSSPEVLSEDPLEEGWLVKINGQDKKAIEGFFTEAQAL